MKFDISFPYDSSLARRNSFLDTLAAAPVMVMGSSVRLLDDDPVSTVVYRPPPSPPSRKSQRRRRCGVRKPWCIDVLYTRLVHRCVFDSGCAGTHTAELNAG